MINIPKFFEEKLAKAPSLGASVYATLEKFEPWLDQSGMPFFPGFTDHSSRHISDVLDSAASLISDEARELMSPADVAILCMGILLHDCGMHLTHDMFRDLIRDNSEPLIKGLGDRKWSVLWAEFSSQANRYGEDKLVAIFGDAQPVKVSDINLDNLTERDCLLVGEFVRRHHARIAHEIAIKGIHRSGGEPLELIGFDSRFKDIAGLLARSHGLPIRSTFDYIKTEFSILPVFRDIKIPYLMAVLRIADYIQVKSERAIRTLLSVKTLKSPISRQEWSAHFAIEYVSSHDDDPEAIFVCANPTNVRTFLKLVALFADIQREMDESWATIGEVYGRRGPLSSLGLTVRRIKSNLDDVDTFAKKTKYLPVKASFLSSGPELLKLLIGPLYDYKYEVGIRELVQNSVDACRELKDLEVQLGRSQKLPIKVTVEINEFEDGTGLVRVTDAGIGMTTDTIVNYFLTAGASFRNSDIWKAQHINELGDVRITRGGRFGVGVLAAYLLGNEISVTTRYSEADETDGIYFTARVGDPAIELTKCSAPHGTTIEIKVTDPSVLDALRPRFYAGSREPKGTKYHGWAAAEWYCQDDPVVEYLWDGFNKSPLKTTNIGEALFRCSAVYLSSQDDDVPSGLNELKKWKKLTDTDPYKWIMWCYEKNKEKKEERGYYPLAKFARSVVNGIFVERYSYSSYDQFDSPSRAYISLPKEERNSDADYVLLRPSVSISDPLGVAPINLQRSTVAFDKMGFDRKLALAVLTELFLELKPKLRECKDSSVLYDFFRVIHTSYSHIIKFRGQTMPFCVTSRGITIATPENLAKLGVRSMLILDAQSGGQSISLARDLTAGDALFLRFNAHVPGTQAELEWFRGFFSQFWDHWYSDSRQAGLVNLPRSASVAIIDEGYWDLANGKGRVRRDILDALSHSKFESGRLTITSGDNYSVEELTKKVLRIVSAIGDKGRVFGWLLFDDFPLFETKSVLTEAWYSVFKTGFVK